MGPTAAELRIPLADACRRAYARGLVAGRSGNASARLADGFLVTPTGCCLGDVGPADLVVVDGGGAPRTAGVPTSEVQLHLALYTAHDDAGAVLHTHSSAATAIAVTGSPLRAETTEARYLLGDVPCVPYADPGTAGLGEAAAAASRGARAVLLECHGAVVWAADPLDAFFLAEVLEEAARVALYLRR